LLAVTPSAHIREDGSIGRASDAENAGHGGHGGGSDTLSALIQDLPGWGVTLITLGAVAVIILAGIYLTRPVFRYIHHARLREMYTALALLIVLGIAFMMNAVGLSPALGTFLAGVVLANTEFRHELESDIQPFKGLLLGLFFITVGAGINFTLLANNAVPILALTAALIAGKGAILFGLGTLFKLKGRSRWLFTLSLAQAGEFGFVLLSFAQQTHVLGTGLSEKLLMVVALSMLATPLLFILYDWLSHRSGDDASDLEADEIDEQGPVIIAGMGRFGQIVNRMVQNTGFKTVVLDHDMETIQLMRRFGFRGFFGDPTRPELLHAAGLKEAHILVIALDDPDASVRLATFARRERPDLHIIARARDRNHVFRLYKAGANDIVREMFDSSLRAGRYVLENIGLNEYEAAMAEKVFFQHDREAVRDLAQLWDPNIPASKNEAYIKRALELDKELEATLQAKLDERAELEE
jgi:CPA2 family monovalent cation:H+ antiporter-2